MKVASSLLTLAFSALLFGGCSKADSEATPNRWINNTAELMQQNKKKVTISQGITGTLTLIEGNCMPIIGPNSTCKEYPVRRKVVIYPYTTMQEARQHDFVYYIIAAKPVLTVECDADGFYQARLATGTYSVFIQENGKLYANGLDGQGGLNPVRVEEDEVVNFNLRLNYAVY
ncbi:carboxypeptidase regulatory-like domain-containing protein [Pontibacter kalidii]|uniref:carboxypeptidase regulatory-like domain-containing protein n=1 Tax=Pontibacter kalidii TaxID=2592049 RepID=UPI002257B1D2|nr:carboxypeptidase regulatory-like domain-containing protein [Pontibacter kalidii]